jgi:hypothetical protein
MDFKGHFPLTDSKIRKLDAATIRKHKARTNDFIERSSANCLSETASIRSKHGNVPSMPDAISTT